MNLLLGYIIFGDKIFQIDISYVVIEQKLGLLLLFILFFCRLAPFIGSAILSLVKSLSYVVSMLLPFPLIGRYWPWGDQKTPLTFYQISLGENLQFKLLQRAKSKLVCDAEGVSSSPLPEPHLWLLMKVLNHSYSSKVIKPQ